MDAPTEISGVFLLIGTPAYMAPEQIRDPSTAHAAADVYSAAATIFELFTGQPPFRAATVERLCYAHLHEPAPSLDVAGAPSLVGIIGAALAKQPADRPSADTLARALEEVADSFGADPATVEATRLLTITDRLATTMGQAAPAISE